MQFLRVGVFFLLLVQIGMGKTGVYSEKKEDPPYYIQDLNIKYSPVPTKEEIERKKILNKLLKSQISFFIGMPFIFLFGHYTVGLGGIRDRFRDYPEEYDFFSTTSARLYQFFDKMGFDPIASKKANQSIVGPLYHPKYPSSLHRANEMFVWVNTIAFSSTIAINILYTELFSSKKKSQIRNEFRVDRSIETYYMRRSL